MWTEALHDWLQLCAEALDLGVGSCRMEMVVWAGPTDFRGESYSWRAIHLAALGSRRTDKNKVEWTWFWVSVFWGTKGFFFFLCFAEDRSLEPLSYPIPQVGKHFNKELFVLCLCLVAGSQTPLLFCNTRIANILSS